jgi:prephenate dehydrogenase
MSAPLAPPGAPGPEPREILCVLGTGLMGGSLGLASLAAGLVERVVGFDADPASVRRALERGAVTEGADSPAAAVSEATLVVIATPVGAIRGTFAQIAGHLRPGAIVTDLGSAKARLVSEIGTSVPPGVHFIGGHPLAGSEKDGIEAATPDLYRGAYWFLTPTGRTDTGAYGRLVRFLGGLGVHVLSLDPSRHDELVALTSHLPQLLSSTLMGFAADLSSMEGGVPLVAAGGFRDMTRIAASSPDLWLGILRENRLAVLSTLERFRDALGATARMIAEEEWDELRATLAAARAGRALLPEKPGLAGASLMELRVAVPDRPGAAAEVLTTVGEAGVNIEDFTVVHSPQGGRGTIHIGLKGEEAARVALGALERKGIAAVVAPGA